MLGSRRYKVHGTESTGQDSPVCTDEWLMEQLSVGAKISAGLASLASLGIESDVLQTSDT